MNVPMAASTIAWFCQKAYLRVAFEQLMIVRLFQHGHQHGVAVADMAALVGLHRQEHGRQGVVAVAGGFRRHGDEQRVGERRLRDHGQIDVGRGDRIAGDEAFAELAADGGGIALAERGFGNVEAGRIDVVLHVPLLEVHLDGRVTELVDHLHGEPGPKILTRREARDHGHGPCRGNLGEGDDRQEQLHPFDPARLDVAEHVAAQRGVQCAVDPVVLLFLHREVGAQHLPHGILRRLGDLVVGREGHRFLHVGWIPSQIGNLLCRFADRDPLLRGDLVECQTFCHWFFLYELSVS